MTWKQTGSGRAFDLVSALPADVDFAIDIAEALAKQSRFDGHTRGGPYSVAQHCVVGAHAIFAESHRPDWAAAFLLHDAHEAYIGDITTPAAQALARMAEINYGRDGREAVRVALKLLKRNLDAVIYERAGIIYPLDAVTTELVRTIDVRMLVTERNQLLGACAKPWGTEYDGVEPLNLRGGRLQPWPWVRAADEYRLCLEAWCPAALQPYAPRMEANHAL